MANQYLAGIDIGTTGAKTGIFDLAGRLLASGYREYTCQYPKPNWVEQDPELLVAEAMRSAREAVTKAQIDPREVAGIALSTQRCCSIFVDPQGRSLRPMISWQDNRTGAEVDEMRGLISGHEYYGLTGLPMGTTWMLTKMLWLRKHEPQTWARLGKVVQLQDYALWTLGADDFFVDVPDGVFFGLWDTDRLEWHAGLLSCFGIPGELLPQPTPSGTQVGVLSQSAAGLTGFRAGTPLCVGAGDQNAATVGAGVVLAGRLSVSMGTGGIAIAYLDHPFRDPQEMSMITNHAVNGKWQLEGLQSGAAGVFRWFRDEIAALEKSQAAQNGADPYEAIDQMIAGTPPGAKGLVLLPYLASATAPRWDPQARGTLVGLTFAHDRACLARAFMEGITLEMKDIVTSMLRSGVKIDNVRIMGGATKSALWNQMQADMYGVPVSTLKVTDAALLGAAIMAGVGAGVFASIAEGVAQMVALDRRYEPRPEVSRIYGELYAVFCSAYEGMREKDVFGRLAEFQAQT